MHATTSFQTGLAGTPSAWVSGGSPGVVPATQTSQECTQLAGCLSRTGPRQREGSGTSLIHMSSHHRSDARPELISPTLSQSGYYTLKNPGVDWCRREVRSRSAERDRSILEGEAVPSSVPVTRPCWPVISLSGGCQPSPPSTRGCKHASVCSLVPDAPEETGGSPEHVRFRRHGSHLSITPLPTLGDTRAMGTLSGSIFP